MPGEELVAAVRRGLLARPGLQQPQHQLHAWMAMHAQSQQCLVAGCLGVDVGYLRAWLCRQTEGMVR